MFSMIDPIRYLLKEETWKNWRSPEFEDRITSTAILTLCPLRHCPGPLGSQGQLWVGQVVSYFQFRNGLVVAQSIRMLGSPRALCPWILYMMMVCPGQWCITICDSERLQEGLVVFSGIFLHFRKIGKKNRWIHQNYIVASVVLRLKGGGGGESGGWGGRLLVWGREWEYCNRVFKLFLSSVD